MSITSRINEMSSHIEQAYNGLQGLGADLTNVNKNIENISMVLDDIYDSMPQVSGEGISLTLDDTRVGKIKSTLKGNTSQDGTPTPTTPIPVNVVSGDNEINVVGKNLLGFKNGTYTNNQGIIAIVDNGKITLNGTGTANPSGVTIPLTNTIIIPSNDIYNLSAFNSSINSNISLRLQAIESANPYTNVTLSNTNANAIIQANSQYKVDRLYIRCNQGTTLSDFIIQPQLEKGSSATTYEPYRGSTYNIDLPVENLFDKSTAQLNVGINTSNGNTYNDTNLFSTDYIPISINTTYRANSASTTGNRVFGACYDSNKSYLEVVSTGVGERTFTITNANAKYIRITGQQINIDNYQIEKGSKQNNFTPYGTTPIELCKIPNTDYEDTFIHDKTTDKWYWHREVGKYVYNNEGSVNTPKTNYYNISGLSNQGWINTVDTNTYLSTEYPSVNVQSTDGNFQNITANMDYAFGLHTNGTAIRFKDNRGLSVSDFKNDLVGTEIYFALATSTNTEITYQPLIDQLNLLEKAVSYEGQTNISQVNNDLSFIISASALKEWQENTSLNSTLSMVNPLSLGNTLNTQENDIQPIEVDNIEPLEEEENEES